MMAKNDERRIIDSLANDKTVEMKSDDLVEMLNTELDKPESEIDGQLVKEILDVLEPTEPDPAQIQAGWKHVKENLPKCRERSGWRKGFARFAAAAAVVAIVLVSTIEDAGAFRWTLIQKILKPVAETFGIIMNNQTDTTPESTDTTLYAVSDDPSSLAAYAMLDEVPDMHEGYIIRPRWLPEGFVFTSGSWFSSYESEIYSLDFTQGDRWFNLNIHIITQDSAVYSREFERNLEIPIETTIGQHSVTFYSNADDRFQSAVWVHENAHYLLYGELSVEEVKQFIENME
ncbi:MAG: DUF4367 domain-containing protein [Clostridia bacterium]|nr:DUF4367 domain-containing protein [Clostridia bacterium]